MVKKAKNAIETNKPESSVEQAFESKALLTDNEEFSKCRTALFVFALICSNLFIILLFLISPESRVKVVAVDGNKYYTKQYITDTSEVDDNDIFYLTLPFVIKKKIEMMPGIDSAEVRWSADQVISIKVWEKQPVGYRFEDESPKIIYKDGTISDLNSETMSIISRIPLINGFSEENQTHLLTVNMSDVRQEYIEKIAEINQYSLSYDDEAIEIKMRDGGILFCSYQTVKILNNYDIIKSRQTDTSLCIFSDEDSSVAYSKACPWNEVPLEFEYWTDDEGNYITNKWGDRCVKHYYTDKNGAYYYDISGNKILIPIEIDGTEVVDSDFLEHFFSGYYDSGKLIIPFDESAEEDYEIADESQKQDDTGTDED